MQRVIIEMVLVPLRESWSLDIGCAFVHGGLEVAGGGLFKADAMMERKGTLIWVASHRPSHNPLHDFPLRRCVIAEILRSGGCYHNL